MALGGVLTLAVGLTIEGMPRLSLAAWGVVAWLAVVNTAFAFTLWNHTLRSLTATESSAINNTMLVQIAALAWLILGEDLTGLQWVALTVVSVGIWFVRVRRAAG
jgi:drug/metabolite transporter (DMT)-like permease